jgi:hypothetical protein
MFSGGIVFVMVEKAGPSAGERGLTAEAAEFAGKDGQGNGGNE